MFVIPLECPPSSPLLTPNHLQGSCQVSLSKHSHLPFVTAHPHPHCSTLLAALFFYWEHIWGSDQTSLQFSPQCWAHIRSSARISIHCLFAEHLLPPGPVPSSGVTEMRWSSSQRCPQCEKYTDTLVNTHAHTHTHSVQRHK